jgi:hypothetical protein
MASVVTLPMALTSSGGRRQWRPAPIARGEGRGEVHTRKQGRDARGEQLIK